MQKNYLLIRAFSLLLVMILSMWLYFSATPMLGMVSLLVSLALPIYTIYQTYKGAEHARAKILKEVGVMVLTLVIVLFTSTLLSTSLGGIASMLANYQWT